ncbi:hypothetical protein [Pseudoxanthomonas kalamensis]|uniref:hypothetical protein n=1 Tax=Pseudoxanthomonas kalamensis TaxID=289483 RepID=UPI00139119B8|nr:hypothetical protein [Pseudoxanthomonas kalamensis]
MTALAHLSIVHCPPRRMVPQVPTNRERIQAYRALSPVELGNGFDWGWRKRHEYELSEMMDGRERQATGEEL